MVVQQLLDEVNNDCARNDPQSTRSIFLEDFRAEFSISKLVAYYNCIFVSLRYTFQPPLVQACFHGDAAEVRALISRKEDVNSQVNKFQEYLIS